MSICLYTFRTAHKSAIFNGSPIKVYAYRFLAMAQDIDGYGYRDERRRKLLQSNAARAHDLFAEHKPKYVVSIEKEEWDNAVVYANPPGALWYDTDSFGAEIVGFLDHKPGHGGWVVRTERYKESNQNHCGHTFTCRYVQIVKDGNIVNTIKSYRCHTNGAEFTPEQFDAWKEKSEPIWLANCEKARQEQAAKDAEIARERQVKRDAKNAEIQAARDRLAQLERERAMI